MINPLLDDFFTQLQNKGFELLISVPCSLLDGIISYARKFKDFKYICATSEGEAVGIAVGAYMAGKRSIVFCQNSGIGNMMNPLSSLVYPFGIPFIMVVSWRGCPGTQDEPQHSLMGAITLKTLDLLQVVTMDFPTNSEQMQLSIKLACAKFDQKQTTCFIVKEKIQDPIHIEEKKLSRNKRIEDALPRGKEMAEFTRKEAIEKIVNAFSFDTAFIATTGYTSRELFEIQDSERNFYMIGSMGHAASIGLGAALYTKKRIIILDGDGAVLMKMGTMASIGHYGVRNLCHILLNNNVHDSTGGQRNASDTVNFLDIANACNYVRVFDLKAANFDEVIEVIMENEGPYFIQVNVIPGVHGSLGRPKSPLPEIISKFSKFIQTQPDAV